jgi:hypothetical protein
MSVIPLIDASWPAPLGLRVGGAVNELDRTNPSGPIHESAASRNGATHAARTLDVGMIERVASLPIGVAWISTGLFNSRW